MTANKLANDNNRLRGKLLDFTAPKEDEEQWRQEKLMELEFLLKEYKTRCTALTEALETAGAGDYQRTNLLPSPLRAKKFNPSHRSEEGRLPRGIAGQEGAIGRKSGRVGEGC